MKKTTTYKTAVPICAGLCELNVGPLSSADAHILFYVTDRGYKEDGNRTSYGVHINKDQARHLAEKLLAFAGDRPTNPLIEEK